MPRKGATRVERRSCSYGGRDPPPRVSNGADHRGGTGSGKIGGTASARNNDNPVSRNNDKRQMTAGATSSKNPAPSSGKQSHGLRSAIIDENNLDAEYDDQMYHTPTGMGFGGDGGEASSVGGDVEMVRFFLLK